MSNQDNSITVPIFYGRSATGCIKKECNKFYTKFKLNMITKPDFLSLERFQMNRRKTPLHRIMLVLFFLLANNAWAQETEVKGRITSEAGNPFAGVSVHVKETTNSTSSGDNGQFSLAASSGSVLVFSYVGFATQDYTLADETDIQITMSSLDAQLDEVVVVGYGTQRKEAITGSVASISGEKDRKSTRLNSSHVKISY